MRIMLLSILTALLLTTVFASPLLPRTSHLAVAESSESDPRVYQALALKERAMRFNPAMSSAVAYVVAREALCASQKYRLPPELIVAVIETESAYDVTVVNGYGAYGLMQVVYRYWYEELPEPDPKLLQTVHHNVDVGSRILRQYLDRFGPDLYLVRYGGWDNRDHGATYLRNIENRSRQIRGHLEASTHGVDVKDITGVWDACIRTP